MKTFEQRLAKAAEQEEHAFQLFERHYRNSVNAWERFLKAREKAKRIEKRIHQEMEEQVKDHELYKRAAESLDRSSAED